MRYFIGQYIQEQNIEANLEKIQKLMFGPGVLNEENPTGSPTGGPTVSDKTNIVMDTINDYRDVFKGKYPADDNYEDQYKIIGFSGGNRKTKRRRTNKKRRSQRKKRRSHRK
jgi:5'-3' exonuclease